MFGKLVNAYARLNPKRTPEESIPLRVSILMCVLVAEFTILARGYYSTWNLLAIPALTLAGFYFSWQRRAERNLLLKLFLSVMVVLVTIVFFRELVTSIYDTRLPLIKLLLWLQVLHSFDIPSRKDLKFSLASGVTLMAAGAVLSTGMVYFSGLLLFSAASVVALVYFYLSEEGDRFGGQLMVRTRNVAVYAGVTWLAGICLAVPLLLLMPQNLQARLYALPLSNLQQMLGDFNGEIENPYYSEDGNPFNRPPQFNPDSYYGFNQYMDLRSRGRLSDEVVLKVRASDYNFYRGVVFDHYNGKGWEVSEEQMEEFDADSPPFELNFPNYLVPDIRTQVETFYVEQDLPNIIFVSWKPVSLYFPANRIKADQFQSLRSPYELTEGTVYSVVSDHPVYDDDILRRFPRNKETEDSPGQQYTQLPMYGDAGLEQVRDLAERITQPYANRLDKVRAIERYLKDSYPYDLDVPLQDEEMDATAYFLFKQKAGYCEHFASAMAVMARSVDIPARIVTGYTGGEYNPFTALWEIRQSDAHAWVEIYYGAAGWVPYDPTPGFEFPNDPEDRQSPWMMGKAFSYLERALGSGPLGSIAGAAGDAIRSATGMVSALPLASIGAVVLALAGFSYTLYRTVEFMTRRRRLLRRLAADLDPDYRRQPVLADYLELVAQLYNLGLSRRPDETLRRFSERVSRYLGSEDFSRLSAMIERRRYGGPKSEDDRPIARSLATAVMGKIGDSESVTGPA